jgi:serine phosphatase RsbU (regulator of sigma subunit)
LSVALNAQTNKTDSLLVVLKTQTNDSYKVKTLHQLYLTTDSVDYAIQGLELAKTIKYKKGIAQSLLDIGRYYYFNGKQDLSLDYLIKAAKIAEEIANKRILAGTYRYIGFIYRNTDFYTAEEYYNKSLKMCDEIGDEISASYALSAIGNIYEGGYKGNSKKNKKAIDFYLKSLQIREKKGSYDEIAASLNETSRAYDQLGLHNKALELRIKGLEVAERSASTENIVYLSHVLGNDYIKRLHDLKTGLEYQLKAYKIGKTLKNNYDVMYDISKVIAATYYSLGDLKKSNEFYRESQILNDSINNIKARYSIKLSEIKHDLVTELEKQKLLLKDSEILKVKAEAEKQTVLRNAFLIGFALVFILVIIVYKENRQKQKVNKELDRSNKEIETAYQTLAVSENKFKQITETINDVFYLYNIIEKKYEYISPNCQTLFGLDAKYFYEGKNTKVVVFKDDMPLVVNANVKIDAGIPYDIEYRIIVNNDIKWVAEKSSPIFNEKGNLLRNSGICSDITLRKFNEETLRKKNKDITDSILYARTIQDAILVPKDEIAKRLNDFFILSKPKEIVSGDFYFYKETKNGIILAAADCTGHGVPAGFLSMIGNAFLNEIIAADENISPAKILDQLSKKIIKSLNQNRSDSESKDGMDIAVLRFNDTISTVQFAGAQNSLYHIRNGELTEIKADMVPVGINEINETAPFTNNILELKKGDSLYIFSDGYYDQLGGTDGRKFMKKNLKELLVSIQDKKMSEQEKTLDQTFNDWKGRTNQLDDVLVIGVRI